MQDVAILMSFGLACPLLGVAIILNITTSQCIWRLVTGRYLVADGGLSECKRERLEAANKGAVEGLLGFTIIVVGVVSVFWGVLVFDMAADVYGDMTGGLCMMCVVVGAWIINGAVKLSMNGISREAVMAMISRGEGIAMVELNCTDNTINPIVAMNEEFSSGNRYLEEREDEKA
jgi:hypothetical protein